MVLGLGTTPPIVIAATTPTIIPAMQISSRSISVLAVALLVGLSQIVMLVYMAYSMAQESRTDMPVIFPAYWMVLPSITAALWRYVFWLARLKEVTVYVGVQTLTPEQIRGFHS